MEGMPFSYSDLAALAPEITLVVGASIVLLWGAFSRGNPRRFAWLSLVTLVGALLGVFVCVGAEIDKGVTSALSGQLAVDPFGSFFAGLFLITAILAIGASLRFLEDHDAHKPEFYFFLLCSLIGMLIMARGADLITLFVGLELQALSVYVLVGYLKADRRSNEGALKYFILGGLSSGIFVYALSLLYAVTGSTALDAVGASLAEAGVSDSPILTVALLLLVVSLGFKVAAVPFHLWAPDAYTGGPTPVSLFISVASKAAAFALALRILYGALGSLMPSWSMLLAVLAVATMTLGNVAAITQDNVKRLLAYSSVAHAGYALIGVVVGTTFGIAATMYYLLAYTFMNVGAWGTVILLRRQGLAGDRLDDFAGLGQRSWWATGGMLIFLLSLGGIPPTIGFLGKWYLFGAAIDAGWAWLAVVGAVNAAVSLYYYLRVAVVMLMREPESDVTMVSSLPLNLALAVSAVITVLGIIWATPFIHWAQSSSGL